MRTQIEKILKTDLEYITTGGTWLFIGHGVFVLTSLLLTVILANMLPKSAYGIYQFVIAGGTIVGAFTLSGVAMAAKQAVARGQDGAVRYGFRIKLLWSIGIVVASSSVALYYFLQGNSLLGTAFVVTAILVPFLESFTLYRSYLLGKKYFKENTLLGFWRKPLPIATIFILVLFTDNPVLLALGYYLSSVITLGCMYWYVIRKFKVPYIEFPEILKYGKQVSIINIIRTFANQADKIIVFQQLGAAHLAIFLLAKIPLTQTQKLFGSVGHLAFPKFAIREFKLIRSNMLHKMSIYFTFTALVALVYILLAPYIFALVFPNYTESVLISQVLMLALLFKPTSLIERVFESKKMIRQQQISTISTLIVKICLMCVCIPLYGIWGAVMATVFTNIYWTLVAVTLFYTTSTRIE